MKLKHPLSAVALTVALIATGAAQAGAIHDAGLFSGHTLGANDDSSTGHVDIGFAVNFFGVNASQLFVNNNGNITFDSASSTFTPFALSTTNRQILAPFFGDVDTRGVGSGVTQYAAGTLNGRNVFGVNWLGVGYFSANADKLNSFQLIITDRSDIAAGDFDFEFNYDTINWETGDSSGGAGGLGGNSARVGWSNGNLDTLELEGSAVNGAFLDGGANALASGSLNSGTAGQYIFNVRDGAVAALPAEVPEPGSLWLTGLALFGAGVSLRRAQRA